MIDVAVDTMIDVVVDMMIDAAGVGDLTVIEVMVAVEGMTTDVEAVMMIDGTMTDVITIGMTHIMMVVEGEDTIEYATGTIAMALDEVVDMAVDAVSVPLMMIVHGGEMNLKYLLEEILEKKDQNALN